MNQYFFHPAWLANFPPYFLFRPMKFAQNNNPTLSFEINEDTRLFGTWEYFI